jgi:Zn-dependent oligopeptidase
MNNPLLKKFNTAPFSEIKNEHFLPAIKQLIAATKIEIDAIVTNTETPTFTNTVEALENTGLQLDRATSIFFNLNSAETSEEIQKIAQEISPLLTEFSNDLLLNEQLFSKVKAVYENSEGFNLNAEQHMLLDKQYKSFARNGANLSSAKKKTLRKLDTDLSKLQLTFGENVLAETNAYHMHLTKEEDLVGLPEGAKEAAAQTAHEKELDG